MEITILLVIMDANSLQNVFLNLRVFALEADSIILGELNLEVQLSPFKYDKL
jgi:hypothetical protein